MVGIFELKYFLKLLYGYKIRFFVPNVTRSSNTSDQNDSFKEEREKIMSKKKSISRRDFIKTTAVGGPTLPVPQPDRYACFQIEIINP